MQSVPLHVFCLGPVRRWPAWGGGRLVPFYPYLALGRVPPCGRACASGAVRRRGGLVWGGSLCAAPPEGVAGGPQGAGGCSPSLCLPCAGIKAAVIGVPQFMEGVASILLRFVSAC